MNKPGWTQPPFFESKRAPCRSKEERGGSSGKEANRNTQSCGALRTTQASRNYSPPLSGGLDLNSRNSGCARLGGEVDPPLGVVVEEVAVLIFLFRRHRRAVCAAVRRAVDDEVPGAIEEEAGSAAMRRVPPALLDALPVHALGALGIVVVVRDVGPRKIVGDDALSGTKN